MHDSRSLMLTPRVHRRAPTLCLSLVYFQSPRLTSELFRLKGGGGCSWQQARQLLTTRGMNSLSCREGWNRVEEGVCWVRGNDGLAKGETEGTGEKGPINILSWLPGSITAVEKLTSHKADKFTSELHIGKKWRERFTLLPVWAIKKINFGPYLAE